MEWKPGKKREVFRRSKLKCENARSKNMDFSNIIKSTKYYFQKYTWVKAQIPRVT